MRVSGFSQRGLTAVLLFSAVLLTTARAQGAGAGLVQATANSASGTTNTFSLNFPSNTAAGNVIVVGVDYDTSGAPSMVMVPHA